MEFINTDMDDDNEYEYLLNYFKSSDGNILIWNISVFCNQNYFI